MAKTGKWSIEDKQPPKGETNSLQGIGDLLKDKDLKDFKKPKTAESKVSEPESKKQKSIPEKGSIKLARKFDNALAKSHSKVEDWVKIDEIAEILKNDKISQIVIHAKENIEPEDTEAGLTFKHDLDSRLALYLLNDFNKRTPEETYTEGSISSVVIKGGKDKNLRDKKDGLVIWIDVGGRWLEVQKDKKNNKNTKIYIDHHGKAKNLQTSASEMTYEILKRAGLLKENRKWMESLVKLTTDVDNLLYLGEKDKEGKRIFNKEYFKEEWPRSLKGLVEDIPFEILIELFKSGKIKDPSKIFTEEELKGEFGQISWRVGGKTKSIAELCQEKRDEAKATIFALSNDVNNAKFLELATRNTRIGDIIYHNFHQIGSREKPKPNTVPFRTAYIGTRAMGYDSFVLWNEKRREFFINSKHPGLSNTVKELEKKAPGTTNVRSAMVFSPKNKKSFENLNEKDFLDLIDPNITEKSKMKSPKEAVNISPSEKKTEIQTDLEKLEEKRLLIFKKIQEVEKKIALLEAEIKTLPKDEDEVSEEELISDAEIVEADETTEKEEAKKPIEEIKSFNLKELRSEMEQNIKTLLQNKEVADKKPEITKFDLVSTPTGFAIKSEIRINKTGNFLIPKVNITLNLPFENKNGNLVLGKEFIDTDSVLATKKIKDLLAPKLPSIIPMVKNYFEGKLGTKINTMYIEEDKLKFK